MVKLTQSLKQWLWEYHRELIVPLTLGKVELFTPELKSQYIEWCQTEEGRQYLQGGSKYKKEAEK